MKQKSIQYAMKIWCCCKIYQDLKTYDSGVKNVCFDVLDDMCWQIQQHIRKKV